MGETNVFGVPIIGGTCIERKKTNVFGVPITEGTLIERAKKAAKYPNAGGKRDMAVGYVEDEKQKYGHGIATLCIFYNATGETLIYTQDHDWYGEIYDSYPKKVQNGQWGGFLHVQKADESSSLRIIVLPGSIAGVEYRGKFNSTAYCKQMFSWDTNVRQDNKAYCDIYEDDKKVDWNDVYKKMKKSGPQHVAKWNGMITTVKNEDASSPLYEAILTIDEVATTKAMATGA